MSDLHEVKWTPEAVSRVWDYYAQNPAYEKQYFSCHSGRFIYEKVRRYVAMAGRDVLDFGCGPGYFLRCLCEREPAGRYYGLDFSRDSVDKARKNLSGFSNLQNLSCIATLPGSLPDRSMDVIFLIEVVEHLTDEQLDEMFEELRRVLRKGGRVVVTTPNREDLEASKLSCPECGCIFHRWQHVRSWDGKRLSTLLAGQGFEAVRVEETYFASLFQRAKARARQRLGLDRTAPHLLYIGQKS